jgi:hypothetical protein
LLEAIASRFFFDRYYKTANSPRPISPATIDRPIVANAVNAHATMDAALSPAIGGRSHEHALIFASTSVIRTRYAAIIRRADS